MDVSQRKEQFSNAYLQAVASVAGYALAKPAVDDDSVDWILAARGAGNTTRRPRVEAQLKCSAREILRATDVHFPLTVANYNDLRPEYPKDILNPRILIVVIVPQAIEEWIEQSEEEMVLRHCGYWVSLHGKPETSNTDTITVQLPRNQVLTPEALQQIMQRINDGGTP